MITNKIISIMISILTLIVIPIQAITTFILGLLVSLSFGLLLLPLSLIWAVLFFYPLLGLSYVYEKVVILRPFIAIIGIPISIIGDIYVSLIPTMGEIESRHIKLIYCQTFPYTWRFHQFYNHNLNIGQEDILNKIFKEISNAKPLGKFIDNLKEQKQ